MRFTLPLAAVMLAAAGFAAVPAASATQATPQGCSVVVASALVDYDAYIAARKAQLSAQRATRPWAG